MEKIARDDDFLADAMEGVSQFPEGKHEERLAVLRRKMNQKGERKGSGFLRIAAAVAMLIVAGGVFWTVNKDGNLTSADKSMAYEPAIEKEETITVAANEKADFAQEINENESATISLEDASFTNTDTKEIAASPPKPIIAKKRKDKFESPKAKENKKEVLIIEEAAVADDVDIIQEEEKVALSGNAQAPVKEETSSGFTLADLDAELEMDSITTSQPEQKYIVGTVRSSNQEPLIGVNIQVPGTDVTAVSNFEGQFKLEWGVDVDVLEFSYLGFEKTVTAITGPGKLEVMMDESEGLSEVVITADRAESVKTSRSKVAEAKKATSSALVPTYRKFERYVRRNKIHPINTAGEEIKGSVNLQFTVQADGTVSNVTVLTSTNNALSTEAIRLLDNGPKWKNDAGMVQLREYVLVFE